MNSFRHSLVGISARMAQVIEMAACAAASDSRALILGETGTGKELVARAIHSNSRRAGKPFVAVNCGAIPEALMESELFGHERGAFTGALQPRPGEFELANGGTLFLDEVGELPQQVQVKLLRVLQEGEVKRLGAIRPTAIDVRVIAATNRDLSVGFRADLYYRLNVITICTPPLRERPEDIVPLGRHFLSMYASRANRAIQGFSAAAEDSLMAYEWPGNVRELQNAVERAVATSKHEMLEPHDLFLPVGKDVFDYAVVVENATRSALVRAFAMARGHLGKAAALLKLHPKHVQRMLKKLDLLHLRCTPAEGLA